LLPLRAYAAAGAARLKIAGAAAYDDFCEIELIPYSKIHINMIDEKTIEKFTPQFNELGVTDPEEMRIILEYLDQIAEIGWSWHVHKQKRQNEKTESTTCETTIDSV
jgi:hypothetical protein